MFNSVRVSIQGVRTRSWAMSVKEITIHSVSIEVYWRKRAYLSLSLSDGFVDFNFFAFLAFGLVSTYFR